MADAFTSATDVCPTDKPPNLDGLNVNPLAVDGGCGIEDAVCENRRLESNHGAGKNTFRNSLDLSRDYVGLKPSDTRDAKNAACWNCKDVRREFSTGCRSSEGDVSRCDDVIFIDSDSGAIDDDVEVTTCSHDDVSPSVPPPSPPALDGGYGWVVVVASFFNAFIIDGVGSCFGLIFPHVVKEFGASAFVTSFAGSLFVALMIMGSVSAALVRRYGYRAVSISGGVLACCAFVLAAWSPNVVVFILTYGLFAGCSCGLVFLPSIVIVNGYFHERRGIANGIITSGSGAGLLVLAPVVNFLLREFSLRGTVLVMAGVLLNMCVFSSLYRPPPQSSFSSSSSSSSSSSPSSSKSSSSSSSSSSSPPPPSGVKGSSSSSSRRGRGRSEEQSILKSGGGGSSSDSGHPSPASTCPSSVETVSTLEKELDGSHTPRQAAPVNGGEENITFTAAVGGTNGAMELDLNEDRRRMELKSSCDVESCGENECSKYTKLQAQEFKEYQIPLIKNGGHDTDDFGFGDPRHDASRLDASAVNEAAPHASLTHTSPTVNLSSKEPISVSPYHELESPYAATYRGSLLNESALQQHCGAGRGGHQLWRSAHHLPVMPSAPGSKVMHSSAHDVTPWGSANGKRGRRGEGLVTLAERSAFLKNRHRFHHHHHHDDHQVGAMVGGRHRSNSHHAAHSGNHEQDLEHHQHHHHHPHHHYHQRHQHHDLSRDHHLNAPHHAHHSSHHYPHHHSSHVTELDQGSNLYLTGSISTLRNLHIKHILHLATSRDSDHHFLHFSRSNFSQGSKSHLSHLSENHGSRVNLPYYNSRSNLSEEHDTAPFPYAETTNSSLWSASHREFPQAPMALFSSKQSLPTAAAPAETTNLPLIQTASAGKGGSGSTLFPSQWSVPGSRYAISDLLLLDADASVRVIDAVALDGSEGAADSVSLPTAGYPLGQLLRMPCFLLFCFGSCLIQIGYPLAGIFLADLAYHKGLTSSHTAVLMGVLGGLNIVGRLLAGGLANMGVRPLTLLYTSLLLGGVACLAAPLYTEFWSLATFAGMFGFFLGFFPPVQPLVIVEYFGIDSLASVFGLLTTLKGASSMLGPPLAGWVYDASGQYPISFVFGGVVFVLSAAVHFLMPWLRPK